ncbi:hypothetical protein JTE90_014468 [Oedothorax gibbosus]|uniref:Uncharacterized protein n=1 Tax=Oedothorax gibbosus TaxID=931172 RepID=A0AAV6VJI7_9ARAC|nr:hypothetical protein JTE90_014468 [Oedothorax gibbosus]
MGTEEIMHDLWVGLLNTGQDLLVRMCGGWWPILGIGRRVLFVFRVPIWDARDEGVKGGIFPDKFPNSGEECQAAVLFPNETAILARWQGLSPKAGKIPLSPSEYPREEEEDAFTIQKILSLFPSKGVL